MNDRAYYDDASDPKSSSTSCTPLKGLFLFSVVLLEEYRAIFCPFIGPAVLYYGKINIMAYAFNSKQSLDVKPSS